MSSMGQGRWVYVVGVASIHIEGMTGRKGVGTIISVAVSSRFMMRSVGIVRKRGKLFVTVPDHGTASKRCHSVTRPVGSTAHSEVRAVVLSGFRRIVSTRPRRTTTTRWPIGGRLWASGGRERYL